MTWQSQSVPPPDCQQPPPDSDQRPPPDLGPSGEAREEDYNTEQHWELATKIVEGQGCIQTGMEHHLVVVVVVEGMVEVRVSLGVSLGVKESLVEVKGSLVDWQEHQVRHGE